MNETYSAWLKLCGGVGVGVLIFVRALDSTVLIDSLAYIHFLCVWWEECVLMNFAIILCFNVSKFIIKLLLTVNYDPFTAIFMMSTILKYIVIFLVQNEMNYYIYFVKFTFVKTEVITNLLVRSVQRSQDKIKCEKRSSIQLI